MKKTVPTELSAEAKADLQAKRDAYDALPAEIKAHLQAKRDADDAMIAASKARFQVKLDADVEAFEAFEAATDGKLAKFLIERGLPPLRRMQITEGVRGAFARARQGFKSRVDLREKAEKLGTASKKIATALAPLGERPWNTEIHYFLYYADDQTSKEFASNTDIIFKNISALKTAFEAISKRCITLKKSKTLSVNGRPPDESRKMLGISLAGYYHHATGKPPTPSNELTFEAPVGGFARFVVMAAAEFKAQGLFEIGFPGFLSTACLDYEEAIKDAQRRIITPQ